MTDLNHYSTMIYLAVLSSIAAIVLVKSNARLARERKRQFTAVFLVTIFAAIGEWVGVYLNGAPDTWRTVHIFVKALELSALPFILFILLLVFDDSKIAKRILPLGFANLMLEVVSGFVGFVFYFDGNNVYHHGPYYWIYTLMYVFCAVVFFVECRRFSGQYQDKNIVSLIVILAFLILGVGVHMTFNAIRADWMTVSMALLLFYIYYIGLVDQIDANTHLLDRRGYDLHMASLRKNSVLVMFDVDYFKEVNDQYGHEAGDACLREVADSIKQIYGKYGLCYRIGGDEFCAILSKKTYDIEMLNAAFFESLDQKRRENPAVRLPNVSVGYAACNPEEQAPEEAMHLADQMMYQYKAGHRRNHLQ